MFVYQQTVAFIMNLDGITYGKIVPILNVRELHLCILMQLKKWVITGLGVLITFPLPLA